jgi:hypothetical protein
MEKLIEQIKLKAAACGDSTKEKRARKGAYIDCLVMIKEALHKPVVMQAEVSAFVEHLSDNYGIEISDMITQDYLKYRAVGAAVGQRSAGQNGSGGLYCVSSDSLVYGKSCDKWCGDKNCWRGEAPSEGVLH